MKALNDKTLTRLKATVFLLALVPLTRLIVGAFQDTLGANPIEKITHHTGFWTLTFLMITLSATPLRKASGWQWPIRLRRMLGLFAFFYACLHFLTYLVLDQFFDWPAIAQDIGKRPYITIGFAAFVLLIPLALTSNNAMIRQLGGARWRTLHRLIYPIAIAGVVHFAWLVKKDLTQPLIFAGLLALLLTARLLREPV
jgi:methionine sulfoxide reductase heme-binding subunit